MFERGYIAERYPTLLWIFCRKIPYTFKDWVVEKSLDIISCFAKIKYNNLVGLFN